MKKQITNLKVFLTKEKFNLTVLILSIFILIVGSIVFNIFISFIAFILINLIWIIPYIKWLKQLEERNKMRHGPNMKNVSVNELGIFSYFVF